MRILIDECLNWRLCRALTGHYCTSAQRMGWSGIKDAQLLALAEQHRFDVFITGDRNLTFQQDSATFGVAVIVLEGVGTQLHQTLPLMSKVLALLPTIKPGEVIKIEP